MSPGYYDRRGKPLDMWAWAAKFEDVDYKRVQMTHLPDGKWVSTVWLGLDHNLSLEGPPLIFETMVFRPATKEEIEERKIAWADFGSGHYDSPVDLDQERYATEDDAIVGHFEMVTKWQKQIEEGEKKDETVSRDTECDPRKDGSDN